MVATPIGNLEDITLRAIRTLKEANMIACEDTRRTKILLDKIGVRVPLVSFHQHSQLTKINWLIEQLASGLSIALVTDAGTPGINDPGGVLVAAVVNMNNELRRMNNGNKAEIKIVPIPGANAAITLLSASGLPADRYLFIGFLPKKKGRATLLARLQVTGDSLQIPIVLYESPERLVRTLTDLESTLGNQSVVVGRELTKQFEEIWRGDLAGAIRYWQKTAPRGEFVLIVAPSEI